MNDMSVTNKPDLPLPDSAGAIVWEKGLCDFCGENQGTAYHPNLANILRCGGCGIVYMNPHPSTDSLSVIYSQEYFMSNQSCAQGYDDYHGDSSSILRTFRRRLSELRATLPARGTLLDVGCATGVFLQAARELGWEAHGIDISEYGVREARSKDFSVWHGNLLTFPAQAETYHLITMWDYIEHSHYPRKDLERCIQLLKRGGRLVISTPDIESLPAKIFQDRWMGFKLHEHLYYFSHSYLKRFLEQLGLQVAPKRLIGKYVSFDLFARRLGLYSKFFSKRARWLLNYEPFKQFEFYCNPFDIFFLEAKKP